MISVLPLKAGNGSERIVMDTILGFFGRLISMFGGSSNNLALCCIIFCLMLKLILSIVSNEYYQTPMIEKPLREKIDEIESKYKHKPEEAEKAVGEFLVSSHYPFFAFLFYYPVMLAVGALVSFAVHSPAQYVPAYNPDMAISFVVPDITQYTFRGLQQYWPTTGILRYLLFPVLGCTLQFLQDKYITDRFLVNKRWFDYVSLGITVAAMAVLPAVFPIFWTAYELSNIIHIFINTKININLKNFGIKSKDDKKKKSK